MATTVTFKNADLVLEQRPVGADWVYYFKPERLAPLGLYWKVRIYGTEPQYNKISIFSDLEEVFEDMLEKIDFGFQAYMPDENVDTLWSLLGEYVYSKLEEAIVVGRIDAKKMYKWCDEAGVTIAENWTAYDFADSISYAVQEGKISWNTIAEDGVFERIAVGSYHSILDENANTEADTKEG